MSKAPFTTQQAAAEVVALINSRVQSPWPQEIEAIIVRTATDCSSLQAALPLSPDHLKYREIIAKIDGFDWGRGLADEAVREPAFDRLTAQATEIEARVWATPAKTLGDVLLRGEIAFHNENAVMASLDDQAAYSDERAIAQVIRAVLDVLGGLHAR